MPPNTLALQDILDGTELTTDRLCVRGGTAQAPIAIDACLRLSEGSGDAADDNSYLSDASVEFLGDATKDLTVPCVFGEAAWSERPSWAVPQLATKGSSDCI